MPLPTAMPSRSTSAPLAATRTTIAPASSPAPADHAPTLRPAPFRPHMAGAYGFREGATLSNKRHNAVLYARLIKDGAFHHKVCPFRQHRLLVASSDAVVLYA